MGRAGPKKQAGPDGRWPEVAGDDGPETLIHSGP